MQGPLFSQVYRAIRADIFNGRMSSGREGPSTRAIASDLAVSRNIVVIAYEQLLAEGYLVTRTGAGTFVAAELPEKLTLVGGDNRPRGAETLSGAGAAFRLCLAHRGAGAGCRIHLGASTRAPFL